MPCTGKGTSVRFVQSVVSIGVAVGVPGTPVLRICRASRSVLVNGPLACLEGMATDRAERRGCQPKVDLGLH